MGIKLYRRFFLYGKSLNVDVLYTIEPVQMFLFYYNFDLWMYKYYQ